MRPTRLRRRRARPPQKVIVEEVAVGSIEGRLTLTGALQSGAVETAIPQVNGRVAKIFVKRGSRVAGGDVVAQLDRSSLQADVAYTKSLLTKVETQQQAIEKEHSEALKELENVNGQLQTVQGEIDAAQSDLDRAIAALQRFRQGSPGSGLPAPAPAPAAQGESQNNNGAAVAGTAEEKAQPTTTPPSNGEEPPKPEPSNAQTIDVAEVENMANQARERSMKAAAQAKDIRTAHEAAQKHALEVEAQWEKISQQVIEAQEMLSNKTVLVGAADIHAPCSGVVTGVTAGIGARVAAGEPLVYVTQFDRWRMRVAVPQAMASFLKPQMTAPVVVPLQNGQERELNGTVKRIEPSESGAPSSADVEILVITDDAPVKADQPATCTLMLGQRDDVMTIPVQAIHEQDGDKAIVYVAAAADSAPATSASANQANTIWKIETRWVTLGWTDGNRWEVIEGLSPDERVIVEGPENLREGEVVSVEPPEPMEELEPIMELSLPSLTATAKTASPLSQGETQMIQKFENGKEPSRR